jgi:hypothetical protein
MRKVDRVMIVVELATPSECKVMIRAFAFHRVLIVTNVLAIPSPASSDSFCVDFGVIQRLHSMVVKRVWL